MENKVVVKIENVNGQLVVSSRVVAEQLGKRHSDVLESLNKILENEDFRFLIIPSTYKVEGQNREYKEYLLTQDGFTLYMFNIQGYNEYKLAYINEFNKMKNELTNSKDIYLLNIIKANSETERAVALNKYELEYVKPLENNLKDTTTKLEHKQEVINGISNELKIKTQRQFLNEIIKMKGVELIQDRWNLLYKQYELHKHINLKVRIESYNIVNTPKIKSKLQFIDEELKDISTLYNIAVKLFESDFKDKLKKYIEVL